MSPIEPGELLKQTIAHLSEPDSLYGLFYEHTDGDPLPSAPELAEILDLCRSILFPGFYGKSTLSSKTLAATSKRITSRTFMRLLTILFSAKGLKAALFSLFSLFRREVTQLLEIK